MMLKADESVNLIQILEKTVSPDQSELTSAQEFLENAAASNLAEYLKALSDVLNHERNSQVARMAAGLQFKNLISSKDPILREQYEARWSALPEEITCYIKENLLRALLTEETRPSSVSQCIAYVAVIDLPLQRWPALIDVLTNSVINQSTLPQPKEACLETIGYICQDIHRHVLAPESNKILTAIVSGMKSNQANQAGSNPIRLVATRALLNSLEFTSANFHSDRERNYLMEVVCEATQSSDPLIRVAALQCLVKIMSLYYQFMEPYMSAALFPITLEAMKSDVSDVVLQGIEFWSNVSEVEVDLGLEESETRKDGRLPEKTSKYYVKGALQYLLPVILSKLTKQEMFDDDDDWNPNKAASVCLGLLANCCEEAILPHVMPFIQLNIKNSDWRYRDAAIMTFGSILGSLQPSTLKSLVEQAIPTLIELMKDPAVPVRDTTAWAFSRICEITPEVAINENYLEPLLDAFIQGLTSVPRVASNVCWALSGLAEAAYDAVCLPDGEVPDTFCLSPYLDFIVQSLLGTTDRPDGHLNNLRPAAYEALSEMIKSSPKDCYRTVEKTTMVILNRLTQMLAMESQIQSNNDRIQYNEIQSLLCGSLQSSLRKLNLEDAIHVSDAIMSTLLSMFNSENCKLGSVQEDVLLTVSTMVHVLGENFSVYMNDFEPYLLMSLKNHESYQVCNVAVCLAGDIFSALKSKALPYADEIMNLLFENIRDVSAHKTVKPHALATFGDIALNLGPDFVKYLDFAMPTLIQASQVEVVKEDFDTVEWHNELRDGIASAFSGIIQGLKEDNVKVQSEVSNVKPLEFFIQDMVNFVASVARDDTKNDSNVCKCLGLIGDICSTFGEKALPIVDTPPVLQMMNDGKKSTVHGTRTTALWALKEFKELKTQTNTS